MTNDNKIYVTKTFLPPQEEYNQLLERIWQSNWVTNRGALVIELENKLKAYLNSSDLILTNNGTISLQLALKAMQLKGEVITTPFSYVATTSSIVWENLSPVFVDIHPEYLTIDETKIEAAITSKTTAILATHVYGNPCHVEAINSIAKKYNLKVIYDAAHCFGVTYKGQSVFNYGDLSSCSFHATKLFHTGEGGAVFVTDKTLLHTAFYHHNFGHDGPEKFHGLGVNGKMSELQAAMGLAVLPHMKHIIDARKQIVDRYLSQLIETKLSFLKIREYTNWNYSYFPVIFESEDLLKKTKKDLERNAIYPRRYFFPSLNTLPYIKSFKEMPVSESVSKRILCLPLYNGLSSDEQDLIIQTIQNSLQC